jgi:hypothetical protein
MMNAKVRAPEKCAVNIQPGSTANQRVSIKMHWKSLAYSNKKPFRFGRAIVKMKELPSGLVLSFGFHFFDLVIKNDE